METIFGGSQATGRFAMGSNEPLGTTMGQMDSDTSGEVSNQGKTKAQSAKHDDLSPEKLKGQ